MAGAGRGGPEELQLTGEEVERLKGAFRDERFRALLAEYAAELADPAQRRRYEEEVAALERERGVQVRFVHPAPGYVLRTSQGGAQRCYLNVCSNALLGRPEARPEPGGRRWSLPYSLAPGREELGRAGSRRLVYDVVFHPETLRLAARSARFRRMVSDTALEAVQGRFGVQLDRANAAPLRGTAYKGVPQAAVIRTPLPGGAPPRPEEPDSPLPPFPSPYAYPATPAPQRPAPGPGEAARPPSPTTPRWSLRHRSHVDLQDYRCCRDSAPSPVPRELVVTIELPLLSSAGQAALEIRGRELRLDSQRPAYRLRLRLPYAVDEGRGQAAFHKAKRQLVVTLPVVAPPAPSLAAGRGTSPGEPEDEPASSAGREELREEAGPAVGEEEGELRLPPPTEEACAPGVSGRAGSLAPPGTPERPSSTDLTTGTPSSSEVDHPPRAPKNGTDLPTCSSSTDLTTGTPSSSEVGHPPRAPDNGTDLPTCPSSMDLTTCTSSSNEVGHPPRAPDNGTDLPTCSSSTDLTTGTPSSKEVDHPPRAPDNGTDLPTCSSSTDLTTGTPSSNEVDHPPRAPNNGTDLPTCPSSSLYPAVPTDGLRSTAEPPRSCSRQQDLPVAPSISAAPVCPRFQCTQDEESLTLLLQVPNIRSESLKGEVGTNHYRLSFCSKDAASYSFLLQFSVDNKLAPPETDINVSPNNAVIGLAKSPESTGLWRKMYFGLDSNTLQERLFVSEENIDEFLDNVLCPSFLNQSTLESQPLIEVLDVTEVKSQIILKSQEVTHCEHGEKEQMVNNSGRAQLEKENRNYFKTNLEANLSAADTVGKHSTETDMISGHCLQLEPTDTNLAISGKSQIDDPHLELAFTTGKSATSSDSEKQELLHLEEQAKIRKDEEVLSSEPAEKNQHLNCKPVPPIIKEINRQDGSVKIVKDHTTPCGLIFQNSLLYELD